MPKVIFKDIIGMEIEMRITQNVNQYNCQLKFHGSITFLKLHY